MCRLNILAAPPGAGYKAKPPFVPGPSSSFRPISSCGSGRRCWPRRRGVWPGGFVLVDGQRWDGFSVTYSGFNIPHFTDVAIPIPDYIVNAGYTLRGTIIAVFFLGLFSLVELYPFSETLELTSQQLAAQKDLLKRLVEQFAKFVHHPITKSLKNLALNFLHILQGLAWLALFIFSFSLAHITFAIQTCKGERDFPYVTDAFSAGVWIMLAGMVLSAIGIYAATIREVKKVAGSKIALTINRLAQGIFAIASVIL